METFSAPIQNSVYIRLKKKQECMEGGKTFIKKSQLAVHQRTHTGEKPYKCLKCGKAFCRKAELNIHMQVE